MSTTFVTLAEVLEMRGGPLEEDEIWSLLMGSLESLVDLSCKGQNIGNITLISPWSLLLSANGQLAFKSCGVSSEVSSFTAPEMLQGRSVTTRLAMEKVIVYSLGMTLYWSVDYQLPQNQPVQLSDHLNCLLLSMCEDMAHRRVSLTAILETCEKHHNAAALPPASQVIKQLAEDVFHHSMDPAPLTEDVAILSGRSHVIRERLHGRQGPHADCSETNVTSGESSTFPMDTETKEGDSCYQAAWSKSNKGSPSNRANLGRIPRGFSLRVCDTSCMAQSTYHLDIPHQVDPQPPNPLFAISEYSLNLTQKKAKGLGPEFVRMLEEPQIVLELPGSIVSKKGKLGASQRELSVTMPSGQCILVRCDVGSRGRDVFDMVVAHANLVEHFYFGLAFLDDDEFFFLDHETKISKVAPDCWKKTPSASFALFLRVKFFVDDIGFILHKLTRHQYYLQLRKDILEDRLRCSEETGLLLGALALQAEFGDYMPEVYGKNYYQPEQYVSRRLMEKMALPCLKEELPRLHASNAHMLPDEAEIEFLKLTQQLPEYGVLFHRMAHVEKKPLTGDVVLGICAKGIIVYEVKSNMRTATLRLLWREIESISATRRKFTVESSTTGKKHCFLTESSKIAQYLLNLCSSQHKFHNEMSSRQLSQRLASEENIAKYATTVATRQNQLKRLSCSEMVLNTPGLNVTPSNSISKSCDDISAKMEMQVQLQTVSQGQRLGWSTPDQMSRVLSSVSLQKQDSEALSTSSSIRVDTPTRTPPEREIICVTLRKDPKLGFGIIIMGEDNTGKLDLGIFIASIVPDGPAERDGRIRPGGRLISLNKTSLEGVTFNTAATILQNSPEEVELIVSQPKLDRHFNFFSYLALAHSESLRDSKTSLAQSNLALMLERSYDSQNTITAEYRPAMEELEEVLTSVMTPRSGNRLPIPVVRILDTWESFSSEKQGELLALEVKKINGSLGISVSGGINTGAQHSAIYIKSLVPEGAAEQDGRIQIGDKLLEVDGGSLRGATHKQAVECLKKTGEVVSLLLERESGRPERHSTPTGHNITMPQHSLAVTMETPLSVKTKDYSFVSVDNTMEVTVRKYLGSLGFSFLLCPAGLLPNCGSVVRVWRIVPGQSAQHCGQLREGDVILAVNGQSVKGLSYQKVVHLMQSTPDEVRLSVCRPAPGDLPEMDASILSPSPLPTREVRSKSLDIRMSEVTHEFSQILLQKAQEKALRRASVPGQPQDVPEVKAVRDSKVQEEASLLLPSSSDPGQQESSLTPEDVTSAQKEGPALVELTSKQEDEHGEQPCLKENLVQVTQSGLGKEGRPMTHCLVRNGLSILADEEYLTISCTPDTTGNSSSGPLNDHHTLQKSTETTHDAKDNNDSGGVEEEEEQDDEDPSRGRTQEFELTVTLSKSWSGSFGFTVTRSKLDSCYYIQDILDNPAKADGRLRPGDRLIMVNGHNVTNVQEEFALAILRSSPKRLLMILGRAVQNLRAPPPPDSLPDIVLYKRPNGQLGIKLTGGIGSRWQGIYVLEVVPHSPASEDGSIQPRDKILYICGKCTMGMTLEDAVKACESAPRKVKLKATREDQPVMPKGKRNGLFEWKKDIKLFPRFEEPSTSEQDVASEDIKPLPDSGGSLRNKLSVSSEEQSRIFQLEFQKPENGGLGFALMGGVNGSALRVKDICSGSVASLDGRMRVGDILLEVNDIIVSGLSYSKVVEILRGAEGKVQLTLYRQSQLPPNIKTSTALEQYRPETEAEEGITSLPPPRRKSMRRHSGSSEKDGDDEDDNDEDSSHTNSQESLPFTGHPIVSEEELTKLALISPSKHGQYSGSRVKALIQILQHQLDQQELVKEFMALEHLKPADNCLVGKAPENREKNRYRDILPYDKTRVPVGEQQEYINASYIRMGVGPEEDFSYICSQGPLPCTQTCFWQMVWENRSDVIAMVTQEVERGRVKCHKYWPEKLHEPIDVGCYQLILDNCQIQDYFHIRIIRMVEKKSGDTHVVKHLKFTTWPDHGTPHSCEHLVRFVRYMRAVHSEGPVTVHCSAGIGRAGVLICTDIILTLIEKDLSINISNIVKEMRLQRYGMIQTKEQYLFCYKVWLDALQSILRLHDSQQQENPL
ncbi:tyrosine-protein phosphatase non-receptor type 13 [Scleropages formosus]|uniref:tyrosine-protein phosphatase non-receptor type 13 n=1 Tax=Scleropages formosus TaxID=113540 RepID=UPI0010FAA79E|nr:tyrosine-protein phosphatase non-receptor type 13-like [Scleropages formosus]